MPNKHPEIFISYSWHDEGLNVADELERCLQKKGLAVMRDSHAIGYKGLIKEYMQRLGRGKCIILVLSDQYFKSPNCMYELLQIVQQPDFQARIFPVAVDGAAFYRPEDRLNYLKYWDEEKIRLQEEIRQTPNLANLHGITADLDLYDDIRRNIARLLDFLRNLNTYPLQGGNCEPLLEAIQSNIPKLELDYSRLPINFSSKIEFLTQDFVGRQDAIARIDQFIKTHSSGYLVIVGEAGIGKSALLAHEVKKRNAVHHFVDDKQNSAKDEVFLRSIVGQLQQQYGFEFEERTPISVSEWNIYFHKWIKEISAEEQLLIFVDALDEAQHYGGSDNLLKYLPPELPENVYFILSSRPEFKKEDITFLDSTVFERYDLPPFTQADIEAYLQVRSSRFSSPLPGGVGVGNLAEATTTNQEIAAILYQKSEGNPLYLYYLLQECENENVTLEQVNQLPQRLTKFYEKQWRERIWIGDKAAKEGRKQILCLLLILKEPPTEELLLELTDFDRSDLQEYLTPLRHFMRTGEIYEIFHDSFKNFLQEKFEKTLIRIQCQIADKLVDWQKLQNLLRRYALMWLPKHLLEAQQHERLFTLAKDKNFQHAQIQTFPNRPDIPLLTLQAALQAAANCDDAIKMAEFLLAHARQVIKITQENPLETLRHGSLERACQLADLCEVETRVRWYLLFAWELYDNGQRAEARATLQRLQQQPLPRIEFEEEEACLYAHNPDETLNLSRKIIANFDVIYGQVCRWLLEWQKIEIAQQAAKHIRNEGERVEVLLKIANALSKTGDRVAAQAMLTGAKTTAQTLADDDDRAEALQEIAAAQAQAGTFAEALATAQTIDDADDRTKALVAIATAQAQAGESEAARTTFIEALATAQTIFRDWRRAEALVAIATAQAQAGESEAARATFAAVMATAQTIDRADDRAVALVVIAMAQAQAGESEAARATFAAVMATAQTIDRADDRAVALVVIAAVQAQAGESEAVRTTLTAAVTIAQTITDDGRRAEALREIATVQAQAGESEAARTTLTAAVTIAQTITDDGRRAEALREIAIAQAQAEAFADALATAQMIAENYGREEALEKIATAQARAGDFAAALATAETIDEGWWRAWAFHEIAAARAQAGESEVARTTFAAALATAETLAKGWWRAWALRSIAAAQVQAGAFAASLATAETPAEGWWRAWALAVIAAAQVQAGAFAASLATAETLAEGWWRAWALAVIAAAQAQNGAFAAALATAETLAEGWWRAWALREIATAQAQGGESEAARTTFAAAVTAAQTITDDARCAEALREIATAQAQAGVFAAALATAQMIAEDYGREEALEKIATAQVRAGDFAAAREIVQTIDKGRRWKRRGKRRVVLASTRRAWALQKIAIAQVLVTARTGAFAAALATAQTIDEADDRTKALVAIATAQAQGGESEAARTTFAAAVTTAQTIDRADDRAEALREIAEAQAQGGKSEAARTTFAAAVTTAQTITDDGRRGEVLCEITTVQARAGAFAAAHATAQTIVEAHKCARAFQEIAVAQARQCYAEDALHTSALILLNRNEHLPEIAKAFAETGNREHFKALLLPCATYVDAAYKMCGHLAQLYPEQSAAIAEILLQQEHLGKKHAVCDD